MIMKLCRIEPRLRLKIFPFAPQVGIEPGTATRELAGHRIIY